MEDTLRSTLTDQLIQAAPVGATLWDDRVRGLHVRVLDQRRSFYLFFRTKSGRQRRPKLGDVGSITLAQARKAAQEKLAAVAAGRDPEAEAQAAAAEPTLGSAWCTFRAARGERKKAADEDKRIWNRHLAQWAGLRLGEIDFAMVSALHAQLSKAAPVQANRVLSLLSAIFSFAQHPMGWAGRNPCKGVERNRELRRKRYLRAEEAGRVADQLAREAAARPAAAAFIWLLILTGARKSEIANARWSDLDGNRLVLRTHKADQTGNDRIIHLPPQAMAVLNLLPRTLGGTLTGIQTPAKAWDRIRKAAGCPDLRLHDLRHSFASAALQAGATLDQVGELLGHESPRTTKRYAHLVDEAAAATAAAAAGVLGKMLGVG